jgi:hypothetical protein
MWHTSNLNLATWLALQGVFPTELRRPTSGRHYMMCYPDKPAQVDAFLYSEEGQALKDTLNLYHKLRKAVQDAGELELETVPFHA